MQLLPSLGGQVNAGLLRRIGPRHAGFWRPSRSACLIVDPDKKVKQSAPAMASGAATWHQQGHVEGQSSRDLSWKPALTMVEEAATVAVATVACTWLWNLTHPAKFRADYAAGMAILFAAFVWLARNVLLERMYQARCKEHLELGDPDSIFTKVANLSVHAKASVSATLRRDLAMRQQAAYPQAPRRLIAAHCYHGFGANLYSYSPVQAQLAEALEGVVTSHDMPGFGLTQRPSNTSEYFLLFNGALGNHVLDQEVQALLRSTAGAGVQPPTTPARTAQQPRPASALQEAQQMWQHRREAAQQRVQSEEAYLNVQVGGVQPGVSPTFTSAPGPATAAGTDSKPGNPMERAASPMSVLSAGDSELSDDTAGHTPRQSHSLDGISDSSSSSQVNVQKVLVGHSLGSLCASLQAIEKPGEVSALILVAPAIMTDILGKQPLPFPLSPAAPMPSQINAHGQPMDPPVGIPARVVERWCSACVPEVPAAVNQVAGVQPRSRVWRVLGAVLQAGLLLGALMVLQLLRPLIILLLRSLVRSRGFWVRGLQQAYYNPALVTSQVIDAYRLPQLVKGWEAGMFMFLTARLAQSTDWKALGRQLAKSLTDAGEQGPDDVGLVQKLRQLTEVHGTPVLIIHGAEDKLVPSTNSKRLAGMLPNCELVLLNKCGHMPQEEWPSVFVQVVREFVARRMVGRADGVGLQH